MQCYPECVTETTDSDAGGLLSDVIFALNWHDGMILFLHSKTPHWMAGWMDVIDCLWLADNSVLSRRMMIMMTTDDEAAELIVIDNDSKPMGIMHPYISFN